MQTEPGLWPSENARGYKIPDVESGTLRPIKVIGIGAGLSGISLAHDIQQNGKNIQLTIYEMAPDVGGTWFWNRCGSTVMSILD
ncbi:hypothetical protein FB45DRAFT_911543 [Roridomyces roridus]|uniref:Uncharacterized protein n=1 Tax=Roridomyces roridus TaxID=1738132 RepID=A0AAD7FQC0_9AGAR|nr:hypothetical protein FB45DRAFT_911543 [Roridomyces roridus]